MIERTVVAAKLKELEIQEFMEKNLQRVGHSHTTLQRTPLGEKVVVHASRPGLVVGRQGESIKRLTKKLKEDFGLENPQVEVNEIKDIYLNANIVAEMIAGSLERFGTKRFKATMHRSLENIMQAGALGAEILLSGKLPSRRARSWRVYKGHLKKSGQAKIDCVLVAYTTAELKSGTVGVQVRIMPSDVVLPDKVIFRSEIETPPTEEAEGDAAVIKEIQEAAEVVKEAAEEKAAEKTEAPAKKKAPKKKPTKKKSAADLQAVRSEAVKKEVKPKAAKPKAAESESPKSPAKRGDSGE